MKLAEIFRRYAAFGRSIPTADDGNTSDGAASLPRRAGDGEPWLWFTAGALGLCLVMIVGLIATTVVEGLGTFWPGVVVELTTSDGLTLMGELVRSEKEFGTTQATMSPAAGADDAHRTPGGPSAAAPLRQLLRVGNYELTGQHFVWIRDAVITDETRPPWAVVVERTAWGRFYGVPTAFLVDGQPVALGPELAWKAFLDHREEIRARSRERSRLEKRDFGRINRLLEQARIAARKVELSYGLESSEYGEAKEVLLHTQLRLNTEAELLRSRIEGLAKANARFDLRMATSSGEEVSLSPSEIVRAYPANRLGTGGRTRVYLSRWWEYLSAEPREANTEGGVLPAIFGTVAMTLVMALLATPIGVLAALYLREYTRAGLLVSTVRIAVNNLAGVPSIVFGVFGLGFFCYGFGAGIDNRFFAAALPSPTFGKGTLIWASATLALLTLPVVIVATEEALAAVPNSLREGSYACGASKWQTIRRVVLPHAMPGVMTGVILAIARGAGEVAPLMLVGAVKLAPELPVDGVFPYLHLQRSFMHLGFHIYDLGFQSPNSEAAKPMVFTTTLLLIAIIAALNLVAVWVRTRLRRRLMTGTF